MTLVQLLATLRLKENTTAQNAHSKHWVENKRKLLSGSMKVQDSVLFRIISNPYTKES